jgi:hypothetical protein
MAERDGTKRGLLSPLSLKKVRCAFLENNHVIVYADGLRTFSQPLQRLFHRFV